MKTQLQITVHVDKLCRKQCEIDERTKIWGTWGAAVNASLQKRV